jgi:hypothetical protein
MAIVLSACRPAMRAAAAGVVSAVIVVGPGCGGGADNKAAASDPVRRASFRAVAARDFLLTCPAGPARLETRRQLERMDELNRFAFEKGAMLSLQLAANDWAGLSRHDTRGPCAPGEPAYQAALTDFSARLDQFAAGIGQIRQ